MASPLKINDLPLQIPTRMMSCLNFSQRHTASLVCQRWYEAAQHPKFLRATNINVATDDEEDLEVLAGLFAREIPNLTICFYDDCKVSLELAQCLSLAVHINCLCVSGKCDSSDVAFSLQHFPNVTTLKLSPYSPFELKSFFCDTKENRMEFCGSIEHLTSMIFEIPDKFTESELVDLLFYLSRVKTVYLKSSPLAGYFDSRIRSNVDLLSLLLRDINLAQNLQELDLRFFCIMSNEIFRNFLNIPNMKLRSLSFTSSYGKGCNLTELSDSDLDLEALSIECEGQECFDVRYPMLQSLLSKKPSLKSFECVDIRYKYLYHRGGQIAAIMQEWPDINELRILPTFHENVLGFSMKIDNRGNQVNSLNVQTSGVFNNETVSMLAMLSPGLQILHIQSPGMPVIADSFSDLTDLSLTYCDLSNVDLSVLGVLANGESSKLTKLQSLCLLSCFNITDADLVGLYIPNLKYLWLTDSRDITNKAVISIAACNLNLQLVGLASCGQVTNKSIRAIASHLRYLRCLILSNCSQVNSGIVSALTKGCGMLEIVDVIGCDEFLIKALEKKQQSLPFFRKVVHNEDSRSFVKEYDQWGFAMPGRGM